MNFLAAISVTFITCLLALAAFLFWPPEAEPGTTTSPIERNPGHLVVTTAPRESTTAQATATIRSNIWPQILSDGIGVIYPPDWVARAHKGTSTTLPEIALIGPLGSVIVIQREYNMAYDYDPATTPSRETSILVDGRPAIRTDYFNNAGTSYIVTVEFSPQLPSTPHFYIEFRPKPSDSAAEAVFENILGTLQIQ